MLVKIMYALPNGNVCDTQMWRNPEFPEFWGWVNWMVSDNPDCNFFLVTITTDIWED